VEMERRRLHRERYSSLFAYCTDRLDSRSGSRKVPARPVQRRESKRRRHHIAQRVRDEVMVRGGMQCTFVGAEGRCPEKEGLQLDHAEPHAWGGSDDAANLRPRCAGHNLLEAERIFGVEFMRARRDTNRSRSGIDQHSRSQTGERSRSGTDVDSRIWTPPARG